jgi:RND family efflux transporter MFP subunit
MRPRWSRAAGVILALAAVGAGIWLTRRGAHSKEIASAGAEARKPALPTVEIIRPRAGGIQRTIQQPASIVAFETVDLYAMVSGYLKTQAVDIGSHIKKGDVLAEINVPRDAKSVEQAASLVDQARAQIVQADAQIQVAKAHRKAAEAAARQAGSDVNRLKAERVLAEKQFARVSELAARSAVDQRLVDEHQSALDAARAAEQTSEIAVQTAQARALAAAAEVDKAKADADETRAALGVAEASRDRLKVNLQYARIVAPFDGVVTHRTFHPGALIHSAMEGGKQPLLTVKRTDLMRVVVLVPDRDVVLTAVGDAVVISVDALDGRSFHGTLARIAQSEDAERLMRVEIDLPNPDASLYDGMYGKATIALQRNARSLSVPSACVVEHIGRARGTVYAVRDGVACKTEVKLGGDDGTSAEILSGLRPDDAVVLRSGTPIEDGMRVANGDEGRQTTNNTNLRE